MSELKAFSGAPFQVQSFGQGSVGNDTTSAKTSDLKWSSSFWVEVQAIDQLIDQIIVAGAPKISHQVVKIRICHDALRFTRRRDWSRLSRCKSSQFQFSQA
jgi:hypothetical protein